MFLGLGGSRRRGAQQSIASSTGVEYKQQLQQPSENPLQALATGKYAAGRGCTSSLGDSSTLLCREQVIATSPSSPLSTYHLPSLSTMSSDSGISLPGSEEAMSRETRGRSQALDLAKKLKSSLGSKFADSLRETIKEVVMKHDSNNNAWSLEECEAARRPWEWAVEHHSPVPAAHSKRLSWFSQEKLSQSAIAELSWGTGATTTRPSTMDTEFFSSDLSCFSTGARASWTDCSTRRSRHIFPEAAAMGTCSSRPESVQLQQSSCSSSSNNPNSSTKKDQSSFADCDQSLLEFLTTHPSATNREQKVLNADSSESWQQHASTSYFGVPLMSQQQQLPELSESKGVKRPREDDAFSSKRQNLLHHDDDDGVKSATSVIVGGFEEYLANLAATTARVPSYELPVSPLTDLLEDLSHDSLVPIHLP